MFQWAEFFIWFLSESGNKKYTIGKPRCQCRSIFWVFPKKINTVFSDSQSTMHMAPNPTAGRANHMDIKYLFTKEAVQRRVVHTSEQAVDGMTKVLAGPKTTTFRNLITGVTAQITIETTCDDNTIAEKTGARLLYS